MGSRDRGRGMVQGVLDGWLDFYAIVKAKVGDAGSTILRLVGNAGEDDDGDDLPVTTPTDESDPPRGTFVIDSDMFGSGSLLSRPASPTEDGHAEALAFTDGDTRTTLAWRDLRWQREQELAKGDVLVRWLGDTSEDGESGPEVRPIVWLRSSGQLLARGVVVRLETSDGTYVDIDRSGTIAIKAATKVNVIAPLVNLTSATPGDAVARASVANSNHDDAAIGLDALAGAVLTGTVADASILQNALRAVRSGSLAGVPTPPSNVGSTKARTD